LPARQYLVQSYNKHEIEEEINFTSSKNEVKQMRQEADQPHWFSLREKYVDKPDAED
jgi:hypothetical protein